jgi:16S rRNA (adenine1518-N6/adenine1519-N6)-dimethyltransferase
MKLTEMRDLLAGRQIQLTKSLGQNFLHDANQLRRIVEAAALTKTDKVLEIGPGLGPLTELLLVESGEVLAIEKDRRLFDLLQKKFAVAKNLTLLCEDALTYIRREPRDWGDWKLVANLPYSVASPILVELAQADRCPQHLVATLQLEVARRLVARTDDDDYGILSLLIQLRYEPHGHFKIPADCFFPVPDVDSACVTLARRDPPLLPRERHATFEKIVKRAFSQRRKMMFKLLKTDWPEDKLAAAFDQLGLSRQIRAEKVTLEQFVNLCQILQLKGGA